MRHLKDLRLGEHQIGNAGAEKIAAALPSMQKLTKLSLSGNDIGDAGAEKIAAALPSMRNLEEHM